MSVPSIPPRPIRSQFPAMALSTPQVPPRPTRRQDRSASPNRDAFARSPLHDAAFSLGKIDMKVLNASGMTEKDVPQRPPSVTLPSIGQEGSEYASLEEMSNGQDSEVQTTKGIAGDLPLHAPTASVPSSTAKSRIAGVTRTDSAQAAVAGIGKAYTETAERSPSAQNNMTRSTSSLGGRPLSINEPGEPGIPEIGVQVPMYPNAGDVQAPTPGPYHSGNHHGFGAGDGPQLRKKHSREVFHGPPGSYGLHGHGILPKDPIERAWYEKHPEALAQEAQGEYGPAIVEDRKEWMLSSDDLNKLVHSGALRATGTGESVPEGQPDEHIGYLASEEYTMRIAGSSRPQSVHKQRTGSSQSHVDSPLRKMSFPGEDIALERTRSGIGHGASSSAVESETEDDIYHIDPSQRSNRMAESNHDLRFAVVPEDDLPILAADEVAKRPASGYMMAAVEPELDRFHQHEELSPMPTGTRSTSRPTSRSNSVSAPPNIPRFQIDHEKAMTPLDDVKEYEPLFPDDEKSSDRKFGLAQDRSKHSDIPRHHFPSRDIWEDTPDSLQLQTTIDSPPPPEEPRETGMPSAGAVFEHPETEANRKAALGGPIHENAKESPSQQLSPKKTNFKQDVLDEMKARPDLPQRFPSQDIWEDTPDHHQLVATVDAPEPVRKDTDSQDVPPIQPAKVVPPAVPARPSRTKQADSEPPALPDRPKQKPVLPARPSKPKPRNSNEQVPLAKTTSNTSESGAVSSPTDGSASNLPPAPKQKPAVPARPAGGKIAALKAGFMSDLNNRLQLGPKPLKQEEDDPSKDEESKAKDVAPLADARKGRARGPQRRKPGAAAAASPSPAGAADRDGKPKLELVTPVTVWQIGDDGVLGTGTEREAQPEVKTEKEVAHPDQKPDSLADDSSESTPKVPAAADADAATASDTLKSKTSQDDIVPTSADDTDEVTAFVGVDAQVDESEKGLVAGDEGESKGKGDADAEAEGESVVEDRKVVEAVDDAAADLNEAGGDEGETGALASPSS